MIYGNRKLDPDKLMEWRTLAIAEIHEEMPVTRVSIPSETNVEIEKEFVDGNYK